MHNLYCFLYNQPSTTFFSNIRLTVYVLNIAPDFLGPGVRAMSKF